MSDSPQPAGGGPPEFEGRKPEVWEGLANFRQSERQLAPDETLLAGYEPYSGLFHLTGGWLVYRKEDEPGRFGSILQFGLPGALVGYRDDKSAIAVQALNTAVVSVVPAANMLALSLEHPGLGERLRSLAARPYSFAFAHVPNAATQSGRERVAQLLLELFIRARAQWSNHTAEHMRLPISEGHIVSATAVEAAPEILNELRKESILRQDGRGIAVVNPDALTDAAGIDLRAMRSFLMS